MTLSSDRTGLTPDKTPDWKPDSLRIQQGDQVLIARWLGPKIGISAGPTSVGFKGLIRGGRSGAIGDSITAPGAGSWFQQLCLKSNGKFRRAINAGIGGQNTAQMAARIATDLPRSAKLDTIFIAGGTNDNSAAMTAAQTCQNLLGMYRYAQSIGADAVLCLLPPRSSGPAEMASSAARRAAIKAMADKYGLNLIDPWVNLVGPDGGWLPGVAPVDQIHPNRASANIAAADALAQITGYVTPGWDGLHAVSGLPGALVTTNDFLFDTGMDGSPDGWTGYGMGNLVAAKTTVAGDIGNIWRISTNGVDAGGVAVAGERVETRTITGLTINIGDRIAVAARVSLSGADSGISCYLRAVATGTGATAMALDPFTFSDNLASAPVWGEAVATSAGTQVVLEFRLTTSGTATPSVGYVEISQIQVWNLTQMGIV